MPMRVPMDRAPFPPLRAQSEENEQLEALAAMLVDEYVEQYDHFQLQTYGLVRADWSPLVFRDGIDIYQHRKATESTPPSPAAHQPELPRLMAAGTLHASLDDIMYATVAPTSEVMHVKMAATRSDDIDGLVLHTVAPVIASDPFRYCGVKWLLRRPPPGLQSVVRKRDFVYLEATGIRVRPDGERIGYHLCHSIEFATTPELSRRGIVRGKMATCHFYRELAHSKVDVWAVSTINMQGNMWRRVALTEGATALGSVRDLPAVAVTKKLMWFQENRPPQLSPSAHQPSDLKAKRSNKCYNCGEGHWWSWKKRRSCGLCGHAACSTCADSIMVFPTGLDPRTNRETKYCCVTCVFNLSGHNQSIYASQNCFDRSLRGSAQSTGALCEDIRPKYDKAPSKFRPKKKCSRRSRTCSGDSGTTLASSMVSQLSAATCPDYVSRDVIVPASMEVEVSSPLHRRLSTQFTLAETLMRLQAVADATYATQQLHGERFALPALYECQYPPRRSRTRASSSPPRY